MQQKIKEQEQEVQIVERKQQIEIAEQEISRKEKELDSRVRQKSLNGSHNFHVPHLGFIKIVNFVAFRSRNRLRPKSSGPRRWRRRRGRG